MTDITSPAQLADLFEKVTVMHSSDRWNDVQRDLTAVLGAPKFSDGKGWAAFAPLYLSDEDGPTWSLLAKTSRLETVARAAEAVGWQIGEQTTGDHETRLRLVSPAGLAVIAYEPLSPSDTDS